MKKFFLIISLIFTLTLIAQEGDWVYRIRYNATGNCPDSNTCYQEVIADINLAVVPDSFFITLRIGTTAGNDDVLSRSFFKASSLYELEGVVADSAGNISVNLGEYLVNENFYIDLEISQ